MHGPVAEGHDGSHKVVWAEDWAGRFKICVTCRGGRIESGGTDVGRKLIVVTVVAGVAGVTAAVVSAAVSTYRNAADSPRHWDFGW